MGSEVEEGAWGKGEEKKISEEKNGEIDIYDIKRDKDGIEVEFPIVSF